MKIYTKALKIPLIASIVFASSHTQAHDYSFLKLLKVGQCVQPYYDKYMEIIYPVKFELIPCDSNTFGLRKITNIGIDYIIFDNKIIIPAQSIDRFLLGN